MLLRKYIAGQASAEVILCVAILGLIMVMFAAVISTGNAVRALPVVEIHGVITGKMHSQTWNYTKYMVTTQDDSGVVRSFDEWDNAERYYTLGDAGQKVIMLAHVFPTRDGRPHFEVFDMRQAK